MVQIAILGSGNVAHALAGRLLDAGHPVVVASRDARAAASRWRGPAAARFAGMSEAARGCEVAFNATPGSESLGVLRALADELAEKVLVDVANAVEVGADGFASNLVHPESSLGEQIQQALRRTRVVKTLNTVGPAELMSDPARMSIPPTVFLSGDDQEAKRLVAGLLEDLGWPGEWMVDLGGIATARLTEAFILWVRPLIAALGPVPLAMSIGR